MKREPPRQLLLRDIRQLVTVAGPPGTRRGEAMRDIGVVTDAAVLVNGDTIAWAGPMRELDRSLLSDPFDMDCSSLTVLPGLVDCHTHAMFAGSREDEFALRSGGATYQQIAEHGGGIMSTVRATRAATKKDLKRLASHRLDRMARHGTTTVEIKTGYGLSEPDEMKMLEALRELGMEHYLTVVPTFLGAHALPPEFSEPGTYLDMLVERLLPAVVRRSLASTCDVFCESGYFGADDTRRYLQAAKDMGLSLRLHADQLNDIGASVVGAELGARTVDHLERATPASIAAIARAGTIAVLLPGSTFFLGGPYAPARDIIAAGVPVALASNFNPGSCMSYSLSLMMTIACTQMRMTPEECITAVTINAAAALAISRTHGSIEPGKKADLAIFDVPSYTTIPYHFGENHVRAVVKNGVALDVG